MRRRLFLLLALLALPGCQPFVLTDNSATDKILATHYWVDLEKQYPGSLICWVAAVQPDSREIYIATNKAGHITRIRVCRVTADGRVWVNGDSTLRTGQWNVVK